MYKIAVIPENDIGPEVVHEGLKILKRVSELTGFRYEVKEYPFGNEHYLKTDELMSDNIFDEFRKMDAILLGEIGDPRVKVGLVERSIVGFFRSKKIASIATNSGLKTSEVGDMVVEALSSE